MDLSILETELREFRDEYIRETGQSLFMLSSPQADYRPVYKPVSQLRIEERQQEIKRELQNQGLYWPSVVPEYRMGC